MLISAGKVALIEPNKMYCAVWQCALYSKTKTPRLCHK